MCGSPTTYKIRIGNMKSLPTSLWYSGSILLGQTAYFQGLLLLVLGRFVFSPQTTSQDLWENFPPIKSARVTKVYCQRRSWKDGCHTRQRNIVNPRAVAYLIPRHTAGIWAPDPYQRGPLGNPFKKKWGLYHYQYHTMGPLYILHTWNWLIFYGKCR